LCQPTTDFDRAPEAPVDEFFKAELSAASVRFLFGHPSAATNALDHDADIVKVQEWLGHANIATPRIYESRKMKPEDSPTFEVSY
jgi:hypothetical protein